MQGSAVNVQLRALSYDESNTDVRQQDTAHTVTMKSLLMQGSAVNVQLRALSYDERNTDVRQQDTAHTVTMKSPLMQGSAVNVQLRALMMMRVTQMLGSRTLHTLWLWRVFWCREVLLMCS